MEQPSKTGCRATDRRQARAIARHSDRIRQRLARIPVPGLDAARPPPGTVAACLRCANPGPGCGRCAPRHRGRPEPPARADGPANTTWSRRSDAPGARHGCRGRRNARAAGHSVSLRDTVELTCRSSTVGYEHCTSAATGHGYPRTWCPGCGGILLRLEGAARPDNMAVPGYHLHPLKGDKRGLWSVRVSGNWRVVFRFEGTDAVDVDLVDYH